MKDEEKRISKSEIIKLSSIDKYIEKQLSEVVRSLLIYRAAYIFFTAIFSICTFGTIGVSIWLLVYITNFSHISSNIGIFLIISCLLTSLSAIIYFTISITRRRFRWINAQKSYKILQSVYLESKNAQTDNKELKAKVKNLVNYAFLKYEKRTWKTVIIEFFNGGPIDAKT